MVVERKMVKNKFKIICLILVMVVLTTTLTGCLSLAIGDAGVGLKVDSNDNLVDASTGVEVGGFGIVLHASNQVVEDITHPEKIYGLISVTRQLPLFLFQSVLSGDGSDNLASAPEGATLEPETVLTSTVNAFDTLVNEGADIATTLQDFALCILLCMWAINFVGVVVNEKFTMEALLKGFMQFICGALLVENSGLIVSTIGGIGTEAMGLIEAEGNTIATEFSDLHDWIFTTFLERTLVLAAAFDIKLIDPFILGAVILDVQSVMVVIFLAVPFYLQIKLAFKIVSVVLTRSLELYIRIAFAPVPIAFAASNGFGPETIRYFRSTMACALQPALMMAGCVAIEPLVASLTDVFNVSTGGVGGVLALCASYIVISTYFGETKQLAHSIIGG